MNVLKFDVYGNKNVYDQYRQSFLKQFTYDYVMV